MSNSKALTFTNENFEDEVLRSEQPVLIDFWAEWCGPCKAVGPVVDELAGEFAGRAKIGKVDIDSQQELAQRYGILSIPTLAIFVNGEVQATIVGAQPKGRLAERLNQFLANAA